MIIALTGGMGCGKSSVLKIFAADEHFPVFDADTLCHAFYPVPAVRAALTARWGAAVYDDAGNLDRRAVGEKIFNSPVEMDFLTGVLYPRLRRRLRELTRQAKRRREIFIVEVPLLYENNLETLFDAVIAVWSPKALRLRRVTPRGWDAAEFDRRERLQSAAELKLERADYGIINASDWSMLKIQCARIAGLLRNSK